LNSHQVHHRPYSIFFTFSKIASFDISIFSDFPANSDQTFFSVGLGEGLNSASAFLFYLHSRDTYNDYKLFDTTVDHLKLRDGDWLFEDGPDDTLVARWSC